MCYNKSSSILAYSVGIISAIILYNYGDNYDKHFAFFAFVYIHIQLAEYFMWHDYDCSKNINHYATIIGRTILVIQPISLILGAIIFNTTILSKKTLYALLTIYSIIVIIFGVLVVVKNNNNDLLCSQKIKDKIYLKWDSLNIKDNIYLFIQYLLKLLYYIIVFGIFLLFKNTYKGLLIFSLVTITIIVSLLMSYKNEISDLGSLWCFNSVIIPALLLLNNYLS